MLPQRKQRCNLEELPYQMWTPTKIYELVYDKATGCAWAHVLPNNVEARIGRPMDYACFVRETGLDLLSGFQVSGTVTQ